MDQESSRRRINFIVQRRPKLCICQKVKSKSKSSLRTSPRCSPPTRSEIKWGHTTKATDFEGCFEIAFLITAATKFRSLFPILPNFVKSAHTTKGVGGPDFAICAPTNCGGVQQGWNLQVAPQNHIIIIIPKHRLRQYLKPIQTLLLCNYLTTAKQSRNILLFDTWCKIIWRKTLNDIGLFGSHGLLHTGQKITFASSFVGCMGLHKGADNRRTYQVLTPDMGDSFETISFVWLFHCCEQFSYEGYVPCQLKGIMFPSFGLGVFVQRRQFSFGLAQCVPGNINLHFFAVINPHVHILVVKMWIFYSQSIIGFIVEVPELWATAGWNNGDVLCLWPVIFILNKSIKIPVSEKNMVSKRYARAPFNHTKHHLVHGVLAELVRELRHLLKDVAIKATPIDFLLPSLCWKSWHGPFPTTLAGNLVEMEDPRKEHFLLCLCHSHDAVP